MMSLKSAADTIRFTTQKVMRMATGPLMRRYKPNIAPFTKYRQLKATFYTDPLYGKVPSLLGNKLAQIFTSGDFIFVSPMKSKADGGNGLVDLCDEYGIPAELRYDNAKEETLPGTKMQRVMKDFYIKGRSSEPYTQQQNKCEGQIRELQYRTKRRMVKTNAPASLWDFCIVTESEIMSRMSRGGRRPGLEILTGDSIDISEYTDFEFYDLIWYWDNPDAIDNPCIGRWLGVSHRVGSALCYWILTDKGTVLSRTTVQHVTTDEMKDASIADKISMYRNNLDGSLSDPQYISTESDFEGFIMDDYLPRERDELPSNAWEEEYQGPDDLPEVDEIDGIHEDGNDDCYDGFIGAEVQLPDVSGNSRLGKVLKRRKGNDGETIGSYHANPLLNTHEYEVEFSDGSYNELTANQIAEAMFSQIDDEGHHHQLLSEISDHKSDGNAIAISDGFIKSRSGNDVPKKTTAGWKMQVEWKDGSTSWVPLKDLKVSNPLELAEYAINNKIDREPAFHWWVRDVAKKRDRMIGKIAKKYVKTSHKFGIRVPKTVDEALQIDKETGTDFWRKAIEKEMLNVRCAFEEKEGLTPEEARKGKVLVGFQEIKCHLIFDIKMDGKFTRKARFVAGGHTTDPPASLTYSSVVSRDSVRIAFMLAALNDCDIWACDIGNAYLNAKCREKIWTKAGTEFGSDKGKVMVVIRALYGLKSSGAAWRAMLAETLLDLGYKPSRADMDVWMKPETNPKTGEEYYAYVLVYVDDLLHIHHDPEAFMKELKGVYRLKDDSLGPPTRYLGANVEKVQLEDGSVAWSTTSEEYCRAAIDNVEKMLELEGTQPLKVFGAKAGERPFPAPYRPEVDVTKVLGDDLHSRYLQLIGVLRWAIELGRIDIITEVSVLSQHQCNPREGHLNALYKIFWYLKCEMSRSKTPNVGRLVFDARQTEVDDRLFPRSAQDQWNDFYPDAEELLPPNMPKTRGRSVKIRTYVDADHAGNLATRRSHTGIFIYLNNALIIWYSKRQNTVESSSFGSEFVALRIATELLVSLRYKLRMFGIPIDGAADVFCDNQSVTKNATLPQSVLNKRHNAICYHRVREAQAAGIIRVGWIQGEYNQADLGTKTTLSTKRRYELVNEIMWNDGFTSLD
mmetsp:Transcript_15996/g.23839  ORF Transcript_15996/g.23839 Transcript_15996/m.23839 type:complete len:1130 (+) Transcript_15996:7540-10929(+)